MELHSIHRGLIDCVKRGSDDVSDHLFNMMLAAQSPPGVLVISKVVDGDTLRGHDQHTGAQVRLRLFGVDTPETRPRPQPFGKDSTDFIRELIAQRGNVVYYIPHAKDRYGRLVASIRFLAPELTQQLTGNTNAAINTMHHVDATVDSSSPSASSIESSDLGLLLLRNGLAWAYRDYLVPGTWEHVMYIRAEEAARALRVGLWAKLDDSANPPINPKAFRRMLRNAGKHSRTLQRKRKKYYRQ